jgi:hypothetical protein
METTDAPRTEPSKTVQEGGDNLLRAVKEKMQREGKVDYAKLRREGYSEETIARLKAL